jgi:glycerate kinase
MLDSFVIGLGGRVRETEVRGPLGGLMHAPIGLLTNGDVVVEMSTAEGLHLVGPDEKEPALRASSRGIGRLIVEAAGIAGTRRVVVGVGGSSSTDGGTGAASERGWRFLDSQGEELEPGGGALAGLHAIDGTGVVDLGDLEVVAACDVTNPLTGARGSASVFGPQKGATRDQVTQLARGLERLAEVTRRELGLDISTIEFGGAGGGMGAGLRAFFGARLQGGFDLLAHAIGLEADIAAADLVITGEGRLDGQSLAGKAPIAVARLAARHNVPCIAVTGDLGLERSALKSNGIEAAVGLLQSGGGDLARSDPGGAIERAVAGLLKHRLDRARGSRLRRRSRL